MTRSFDVFFDLRLNKRLSKQPWGWWFETPAWSLWRHRNARNFSLKTKKGQWHIRWVIIAPVCDLLSSYSSYCRIGLVYVPDSENCFVIRMCWIHMLTWAVQRVTLRVIGSNDIKTYLWGQLHFPRIIIENNSILECARLMCLFDFSGKYHHWLVLLIRSSRTGDKPLPEPMVAPFNGADMVAQPKGTGNFNIFGWSFKVLKINDRIYHIVCGRNYLSMATFEVWEWVSNFIPHIMCGMYVIMYPCWD